MVVRFPKVTRRKLFIVGSAVFIASMIVFSRFAPVPWPITLAVVMVILWALFTVVALYLGWTEWSKSPKTPAIQFEVRPDLSTEEFWRMRAAAASHRRLSPRAPMAD